MLSAIWQRLRNFSGLDGTATYLGPRWLLLRAVGLTYLVIFAGIIAESSALIGPHGLVPLTGLIAQQRAAYPGALEAFLHAPGLFWLNASPGMIGLVQWTGMLAALALVLNRWPRMSLFVCWVCLLSFAQGWVIFSDPLLDWLMLEATLLCIPFAPAGLRPGAGASSPPRPITVFMMRWLLFRVMFECGLSKFIHADPRWLDLTAMDDLYQTAPAPTILGYLDHQLPHAWHVGEIGLTVLAELVAPLVAMFGGRRARWYAFGCWTIFQAGIWATCNFGWLNTSSIALGLLLLDDQMLAAAAAKLRLRSLAAALGRWSAAQAQRAIARWRLNLLRVALWTHFALGLVVFAESCKVPENVVLSSVSRPFKLLLQGFGSVNSYTLFAWLDQFRSVVEFSGSNDGGRTWRTYDLRYFPQRADRISPFIAPYFPRFEGAMQIELSTRDKPTTLFGITAVRLLERNPEVIRLFERDPFTDRPPQMMRLVSYRLKFTSLATWRATREYWHREYVGEYLPMKYVDDAGQVVEADTVFKQVYVKAAYGNPEAQSYLGLMYLNGEEGAEKDGAEAAKWLRAAADQGVAAAQFNLALLYLNGDGVPKNPAAAAHWCRLAAEQGIPDAQDRLGILYFEGTGLPRDPVEALVWFKVAALAGHAEAVNHQAIVEPRLGAEAARIADERSRLIFASVTQRVQAKAAASEAAK